MPVTPRPPVLRRNVVATLTSLAVGASSLLLSTSAGAAHFPAADDGVVEAAASYLAGTLNDAGLVTISSGIGSPGGRRSCTRALTTAAAWTPRWRCWLPARRTMSWGAP